MYNNIRFHESLDTKWFFKRQGMPWSRLPAEARVCVASKLFDEVEKE
ncbi:hypothetical protein [Archaeoglobus sulfaticallidus]|nr:hypothetical protein [Archaeoglobus sulfaticallidus]